MEAKTRFHLKKIFYDKAGHVTLSGLGVLVYSEMLAGKIRIAIAGQKGWTEKKMFGGMAFMLDGKMCCGVVDNDLLVRVGAERYDEALRLPNSRPMDFTGRPMKGFIYVNASGWSKEASLKKWLEMGTNYVSKLPKKKTK